MILNLGCGKTVIKDAVNVDFGERSVAEFSWNLLDFPYPWETNSVDKIYLLHVLEHFQAGDVIKILFECYRILKPEEGELRIDVPHFSSMMAFVPIDHQQYFGYQTLDFLTEVSYISDRPLFSIVEKRISWIAPLHWEKESIPFDFKKMDRVSGSFPVLRKLSVPLRKLVDSCINVFPVFAERFFRTYLGGFDEITFALKKVPSAE